MPIIQKYYRKSPGGLNDDALNTSDVANIINQLSKTCPGRDVSKVTSEMVLKTAVDVQAKHWVNPLFWGKSGDEKKAIIMADTQTSICNQLPLIGSNQDTPVTPQTQPSTGGSWAADDNMKYYYILGGVGLVAIVGGAMYLKKTAKPKRRKKR